MDGCYNTYRHVCSLCIMITLIISYCVTRKMSFSINDELLCLLLTYTAELCLVVFLLICLGHCLSYFYRWVLFCIAQFHCFQSELNLSCLDATKGRFTTQSYVLCILSGVVFLLIGSYWPIVYCWKRKVSRNFAATHGSCGFFQYCRLSPVGSIGRNVNTSWKLNNYYDYYIVCY